MGASRQRSRDLRSPRLPDARPQGLVANSAGYVSDLLGSLSQDAVLRGARHPRASRICSPSAHSPRRCVRKGCICPGGVPLSATHLHTLAGVVCRWAASACRSDSQMQPLGTHHPALCAPGRHLPEAHATKCSPLAHNATRCAHLGGIWSRTRAADAPRPHTSGNVVCTLAAYGGGRNPSDPRPFMAPPTTMAIPAFPPGYGGRRLRPTRPCS